MNYKLDAMARRNSAVFALLLTTFFSTAASAQGLTKAQGFLTTIQTNLTTFIPIIAVIAGLILVIMYWFRVVEKDTFMRWIVGLIIAGSITEIVALFVS